MKHSKFPASSVETPKNNVNRKIFMAMNLFEFEINPIFKKMKLNFMNGRKRCVYDI